MSSIITMYESQLCGYCRAASKLFQRKGWDYQAIVIDGRDDLRQEMRDKSDRNTVPQIWIGDHHVGGFDDLAELEADGELDQLYQQAQNG